MVGYFPWFQSSRDGLETGRYDVTPWINKDKTSGVRGSLSLYATMEWLSSEGVCIKNLGTSLIVMLFTRHCMGHSR